MNQAWFFGPNFQGVGTEEPGPGFLVPAAEFGARTEEPTEPGERLCGQACDARVGGEKATKLNADTTK